MLIHTDIPEAPWFLASREDKTTLRMTSSRTSCRACRTSTSTPEPVTIPTGQGHRLLQAAAGELRILPDHPRAGGARAVPDWRGSAGTPSSARSAAPLATSDRIDSWSSVVSPSVRQRATLSYPPRGVAQKSGAEGSGDAVGPPTSSTIRSAGSPLRVDQTAHRPRAGTTAAMADVCGPLGAAGIVMDATLHQGAHLDLLEQVGGVAQRQHHAPPRYRGRPRARLEVAESGCATPSPHRRRAVPDVARARRGGRPEQAVSAASATSSAVPARGFPGPRSASRQVDVHAEPVPADRSRDVGDQLWSAAVGGVRPELTPISSSRRTPRPGPGSGPARLCPVSGVAIG